MDTKDVFKVLANDTRLQILQWLKHPENYFLDDGEHYLPAEGVCVGSIQKKAGLAQSTISHYLAMLEEAGLVTSTRHGQWTYYRRNDAAFTALADQIAHQI